MKAKTIAGLLFLIFLHVGGCASLKPIPLDPGFWRQPGKKVVVVLTESPPAQLVTDVSTINRFAGGRQYIYGGILNSPEADYEPLRYAETQPLREAVAAMTPSSFLHVRKYFIKGLKDRGFDAVALDEPVVVKELPEFKDGTGEETFEKRDYRGIARSVQADYILLVKLDKYGPYCHFTDLYNDYIEVRALARAELLDAKTNRILWRTGSKLGDFRKPVKASTFKPEHVPVVIEAQQALLDDAARTLSVELFRTGS